VKPEGTIPKKVLDKTVLAVRIQLFGSVNGNSTWRYGSGSMISAGGTNLGTGATTWRTRTRAT